MSNKKFFIIDGYGFIFRAYYGMPKLINNAGIAVGAVYGFLKMIISIINLHKPDYLLIALDSPGATFRDEIYIKFLQEEFLKISIKQDEGVMQVVEEVEIQSPYKANRKETPDDLKSQFPIINKLIEAMSIKKISYEKYEADDIIASYVGSYGEKDIDITIVTSDKDLYQLIGDRVSVYDPVKKLIINKDNISSIYPVQNPSQIKDYLAIVGDVSDNVPGIKGVGKKSAEQLLKYFKKIDNIISYIDKFQNGNPTDPINQKLHKLIINSKNIIKLSHDLVTLRHDLPVHNIEDFELKINYNQLEIFCQEYNFSSVTKKLNPKIEMQNNLFAS
jgi:DNA polymerase-1